MPPPLKNPDLPPPHNLIVECTPAWELDKYGSHLPLKEE